MQDGGDKSNKKASVCQKPLCQPNLPVLHVAEIRHACVEQTPGVSAEHPNPIHASVPRETCVQGLDLLDPSRVLAFSTSQHIREQFSLPFFCRR